MKSPNPSLSSSTIVCGVSDGSIYESGFFSRLSFVFGVVVDVVVNDCSASHPLLLNCCGVGASVFRVVLSYIVITAAITCEETVIVLDAMGNVDDGIEIGINMGGGGGGTLLLFVSSINASNASHPLSFCSVVVLAWVDTASCGPATIGTTKSPNPLLALSSSTLLLVVVVIVAAVANGAVGGIVSG